MDWISIIYQALGEIISPTTAAYALATIGLGIHFGYTGLLNFGQAAFLLIGAYGYAIATLTFGAPLWAAVLTALLAAVVFALLLGVPTLRLRADYLAIVTIAAAEVMRFVVTTTGLTDITGAANGLSGYKYTFEATNPIPPGTYGFGPWRMNEYDWWVRIVGWGLVALASVVVWLLMRSPWGRVVRGIREDEDAVRSLGKRVFAYKMQALVLGGVMGAVAGIIFILPRAVQPANYGTQLTFFVWTIMLLGGAATIFGPILGSILFWVVLSLTQGLLYGAIEAGWLPFLTTTQAGQIRFIMVGLALMLLVIFRPQGILGNKKELTFSA